MDNERTQWAARMLAQRVNGMAVLYPAALRMKHPFPQMEEKYAKLAYCSRYAFSAARSQRTPEEAAPDSVLSFRYLGHIFVKAAPGVVGNDGERDPRRLVAAARRAGCDGDCFV